MRYARKTILHWIPLKNGKYGSRVIVLFKAITQHNLVIALKSYPREPDFPVFTGSQCKIVILLTFFNYKLSLSYNILYILRQFIVI